MHVGYASIFQNPHNARSDREVWNEELRMACLAEPLGFDSVWAIEHHFTDYTMSPDPLQFLSYMAAKTERIRLGTMVVVLPWHDPVRVAEQISLLDTMSDGRLILGLGRGLGRVEFEGFRTSMDEGRDRFVEYAQLVLDSLEVGYMEGGELTGQPKRDLRPFSDRSFKGRTYAAAVSPESMDVMASLGIGLLVVPQKPWQSVREDFDRYHSVWRDVNGDLPIPKPLCGGFYFVDENEDRAMELGMKYVIDYYHTAMKHYEMTGDHFGSAKSYEYYSNLSGHIDKRGKDGAAEDFASLHLIGTPDQVLEKLQFIRDTVDMNGIMVQTSYAGMPWDEAERNLRCFTEHCMPELKKWETDPLGEVAELGLGIPLGA